MGKARAAGSFLGGLTNNPGLIVILLVLGGLFIFRDKISNFVQTGLEGFGEIDITLPEITFPDFPEFPEFPELPPLPDFCALFGLGCPDDGFSPENPPPVDTPLPPDVIDDPEFPLGPIDPGEGCVLHPDGTVTCDTPPTFDVCVAFPELCQEPEEPRPPVIPNPDLDLEPSDAELFAEDFPGDSAIPPGPVFEPPIAPPPGFEVGGPGTGDGTPPTGTIFQTSICNMSLGQIIDAGLASSASAAADLKFQECEESDFNFGTNTGSGFGPGDDPLGPVIPGGATLESEEQIAACTTCQLFGLNCGICSGSI